MHTDKISNEMICGTEKSSYLLSNDDKSSWKNQKTRSKVIGISGSTYNLFLQEKELAIRDLEGP